MSLLRYIHKFRISPRHTTILILLLLMTTGCALTANQPEPTQAILSLPSTTTYTPRPTEGSRVATTTLYVEFTETPTQVATATATLQPSPTVIPPGAVQILTKLRIKFVFVPEGDFLMGSTDEDPGADVDEKPQHKVWLSDFWIGQTEVTNAMFAAFLNEMGNLRERGSPWLNASDENALIYQTTDGLWLPKQGYEDYPVVEVTWYGASEFCSWLGGRLPSEAEWEKAARGTDGRLFPPGSDLNCEQAQFITCPQAKLLPVGSRPDGASPYNALDMAGNAWEWVQDWYSKTYYATSPVENPTGPEEGLGKVHRGGSWAYNAKHARAADRRYNGPLTAQEDYGFRCVITDWQP